ncbi:MAG: hypothetical protein LBC55_01505 [Desulfovibrio sp.]|jgi:predicted N-acetyltransferase YhbS|nr:hypothetical protein [Desulfovibrio sp.]
MRFGGVEKAGLCRFKEEQHTMNVRLEHPADYTAVERLTFAAFEIMKLPRRTRTNKHYLANSMRGSAAFVPELDFVGESAMASQSSG